MTTTVFSLITYRDPRAGTAFLQAIGFTEVAAHWSEDDPGRLDHAEFAWPGGGRVMCDSAGRDAPGGYERRVGVASLYCVLGTDEAVDATYRQAVEAGATSLQEPTDQDYGGRSAGVRDAEGNQFSFGSYPGAAARASSAG